MHVVLQVLAAEEVILGLCQCGGVGGVEVKQVG